MNFQPVNPDANYFIRFASETGRWECGLTRMLFGVRVRAGVAGTGGCVVDYCAGADRVFMFELLLVVVEILEALPESTTEAELSAMLPGHTVKPINQDPACWPQLQALRDRLTA